MLWLFIRFFLRNCTNKKKTATAFLVTTAAAAATKIQFNLLTRKLNSAGPIKIPTTDIPQSPRGTTAKHVTHWAQTNFIQNFDCVDR